jgi:hypothetical protein
VRVLFGEVGDATDDPTTPACFGFDEDGDVLDLKLAIVIGVVDHEKS